MKDLRIINHACGIWPPDCSKSAANRMASYFYDMKSRTKFFDVILFPFLKFRQCSKFHVNIITDSRVMTIFIYREFVQEIEKTLVLTLSNIRGLERDKDTKFGIVVSNQLLQSIECEVTDSQIDPKAYKISFNALN